MQDEMLIKLLTSDAERGMRLIMEHYAGIVRTVIKNRLSSAFSADVDDITADAFLEFYQNIHRFDLSRGSIKAYLCTIAKNNAIDFLRRHQAPPLSLNETILSEEQAVWDTDPDNALLKKCLMEAIISLDKTDRDIIMRKYYLGESTKEIASALGMNVSAVDTRAHRALKKIRKQIGGES